MPDKHVAFLLTIIEQSSINNYDVDSSCFQRSGNIKEN
jgi:hypothetical protein